MFTEQEIQDVVLVASTGNAAGMVVFAEVQKYLKASNLVLLDQDDARDAVESILPRPHHGHYLVVWQEDKFWTYLRFGNAQCYSNTVVCGIEDARKLAWPKEDAIFLAERLSIR